MKRIIQELDQIHDTTILFIKKTVSQIMLNSQHMKYYNPRTKQVVIFKITIIQIPMLSKLILHLKTKLLYDSNLVLVKMKVFVYNFKTHCKTSCFYLLFNPLEFQSIKYTAVSGLCYFLKKKSVADGLVVIFNNIVQTTVFVTLDLFLQIFCSVKSVLNSQNQGNMNG